MILRKKLKKKLLYFLDQIENETKLFKTQSVISIGMGISGNANAGLDTDVVTVVGDLGAIDLQISNKPKSDQYYTAAFFPNNTRFETSRGDTLNYVISLSRQVYRDFSVLTHQQVYFLLIENLICLMTKNLVNKSIFTPSLTAFKVFLQGSELLRSHRAEVDWKATLKILVLLA